LLASRTPTRSSSGVARTDKKGIEFELLPAYARELNPVEAMWRHAEYSDLADYVPDDVEELGLAVHDSLNQRARHLAHKRFYFKTAQRRI